MTTTIFEAIKSLNKDAQVAVGENDLDQIEWLNGTKEITKADIQAEMDRMDKEYADNEYQRSRASEYPSITDVVVALAEKEEGDSAMWDDITAKRQAVKTKYKKG